MLNSKIILAFLFILLFRENSISQTVQATTKADSLFNIGHYAEALNENLNSLHLIKSNNWPLLAIAHFKIGRSYYYLQKKKTAIEWFRNSNNYAIPVSYTHLAIIAIIIAAVYPMAKKALKTIELGVIGITALALCFIGVNEMVVLFGAGAIAMLLAVLKRSEKINCLLYTSK